MIDENKLIERLQEYIISSTSGDFAHGLVTAVYVTMNQPKIGGWIPCSERLPEVEQTVLLSLRSLDVSVGFRANTDGYFYTEGEGYVLYENVLAWQPLPEAYHE